jgi:hypothetical protein
MIVEIILAFARRLPEAGMVIAGGGGLSIMTWTCWLPEDCSS